MSPATTTAIGAEVLDHLQAQIVSARRLLACILRQGAAVRARDVEAVLGRLSDVQTEMVARAKLETERTGLLLRAGTALGVPATQVTLERLCALVTPGAGEVVRARSAELRGLLAEIAREHGINRALMRQELAFLAHLTRLIGRETEPGYRATGGAAGPAPSSHHVLDLQA